MWRCRGCAALLGLHEGSELRIKYKEHESVVVGTVRIRCRRCATTNTTTTSPTIGAAV
jgi:hypothetical protein